MLLNATREQFLEILSFDLKKNKLFFMYFIIEAPVVCICECGCYRRSEVPGGGPGLEGISGGGDPMPISGSCVNRKPCRRSQISFRHIFSYHLDPVV